MSKRRIIIPKGLLDDSKENSIIELSSRLNDSQGDLIAKRQGKILVAQQLPDWDDSLSFAQRPVESYCSDIFSTPHPVSNTTYFSQNTTGASADYLTATSADSTTATCYISALEATPSRVHFNVTGNDLTLNSTVESNVQITESMLANVLNDTRQNLESSAFLAPDESYVLKPPRRMPYGPTQQTYVAPGSGTFSDISESSQERPPANQTYPPAQGRPRQPNQTYPLAANDFNLTAENCPCSTQATNIFNGDFQPSRTSSLIPSAAPANQTFAPPVGAQTSTRGMINQSHESHSIRSPQTLPKAPKRSCLSRQGHQTFPRSSDRNQMFAPPVNQTFGGSPPLNQTFAGSPGRMSSAAPSAPPNQTFAAAAASQGQTFAAPVNQTFGGSPPNLSFAAPANAGSAGRMVPNQTYVGGCSPECKAFPGNISQHYTTPTESSIRPTSPHSLPRASTRGSPSRPGHETFPRSAGRSPLETRRIRVPCSPPRDFASDESYEFGFQPWQTSTMKSMSLSQSTDDSLRVDMYTDRSVQPGQYNVITPMSPSPPRTGQTYAPSVKQTSGGSPARIPPAQYSMPANQTFEAAGAPIGQTFAAPVNQTFGGSPAKYPTPPNQTFATPVNQTFAGCPGRTETNQTYAGACQSFPGTASGGNIRPTSPHTLPGADKRRGRSRPGSETFPRSTDRSLLETGSIRAPCSPPRDYFSDESYEFGFQPWQTSTMRSMSLSESTDDSLRVDMYTDRSVKPGQYNIITPMTPSPPRQQPNITLESGISPLEKSKSECACAPDDDENVVSYTSQVFEESYEEN